MRLILSGSTPNCPEAHALTVHHHQPEPLVANGRVQESRIPCMWTAPLPSLLVETKWARLVMNRPRGEIWRSRSQLVSAVGRTAMLKMRHCLS